MTDYSDSIELNQVFAKLRAELGIRRKKIADAVGVTSRAVKRWEENTNQPTPSEVRRLDVAGQALREAVAKKVAAELSKKVENKKWSFVRS
jgi:transcriptional regulator with XRE-family HTH domain